MGASKDMWVDAIEAIGDDCAAGALDFEEAVSAMVRLGLDAHEAQTMLQEQYT